MSGCSTPNAKRRRLDAAQTKLSQPFKSPFKSPIKDAASKTAESTANAPQPTPATSQAANRPTAPLSNAHHRSSPPSQKSFNVHMSSRSSAVSSPQIRTLQSGLSTLTKSLDTHSQALRLETSSKDDELEASIALWRSAARAAAEELFAGCRDRVNRMGGVRAWREKARERERVWGEAWDGGGVDAANREGRRGGEDGDGDGDRWDGEREEEELQGLAEQRERAEAEEEERKKREEEFGNEDGGFTMDMMLKSLAIDLAAMGYDVEGQRWIT